MFLLYENFKLEILASQDDRIIVHIFPKQRTECNTSRQIDRIRFISYGKQLEIHNQAQCPIFDTVRLMMFGMECHTIVPNIMNMYSQAELDVLNVNFLQMEITARNQRDLQRAHDRIFKPNIENGLMGNDDDTIYPHTYSVTIDGKVTASIPTRVVRNIEFEGRRQIRTFKRKVHEVLEDLMRIGFMPGVDHYKDSCRIFQRNSKWSFLLDWYTMDSNSADVFNTCVQIGTSERIVVTGEAFNFCTEFNQHCPGYIMFRQGTTDIPILIEGKLESTDPMSLSRICDQLSGYFHRSMADDVEHQRLQDERRTEFIRQKRYIMGQFRRRNVEPTAEEFQERLTQGIRRFTDGEFNFQKDADYFKHTRYYRLITTIAEREDLQVTDILLTDKTGHVQRTTIAEMILKHLEATRANTILGNPNISEITSFLLKLCQFYFNKIETELGLREVNTVDRLKDIMWALSRVRFHRALGALCFNYFSTLNTKLYLSDIDYQIMMRNCKGLFGENFVAASLEVPYEMNMCPSLRDIFLELGASEEQLCVNTVDLGHFPDLFYFDRNENTHIIWEIGYQTNYLQKRTLDTEMYEKIFREIPELRNLDFKVKYAHFGPNISTFRTFTETVGTRHARLVLEEAEAIKEQLHEIARLVNASVDLSAKHAISADLDVVSWRRSLIQPKFANVMHPEASVRRQIEFLQGCNPDIPEGIFMEMYEKRDRFDFLNQTVEESENVVNRFVTKVFNDVLARRYRPLVVVDEESVMELCNELERFSNTEKKIIRKIDSFLQLPINFDYSRVRTMMSKADKTILNLSLATAKLKSGQDKTLCYKLINWYGFRTGVYIKLRRNGNAANYKKDYWKLRNRETRHELLSKFEDGCAKYYKEEKKGKLSAKESISQQFTDILNKKLGTNLPVPLETDYQHISPMTKALFDALDVLKPVWTLSGKDYILEMAERKSPEKKKRKLEEGDCNIDWQRQNYIHFENFLDDLGSITDTDINITSMWNEKLVDLLRKSFPGGSAMSHIPQIIEIALDEIKRHKYTAVFCLAAELATIYQETMPNRRSHGRLVMRRLGHFNCYAVMLLPYMKTGTAKTVLVRDAPIRNPVKTSQNGPVDDKRVSHYFYLTEVNTEWWEAAFGMSLCAAINMLENENKITLFKNKDPTTLQYFNDMMSRYCWLTIDNKRHMDVFITSIRYLYMNLAGISMNPSALAEKVAMPVRHTSHGYFLKRLINVLRTDWLGLVKLNDEALEYFREKKPYTEPNIGDWFIPNARLTTNKSLRHSHYIYHLINKRIRNREQEKIAVFQKNIKHHVKIMKQKEKEDQHDYIFNLYGVCEHDLDTQIDHCRENTKDSPWTHSARIVYSLSHLAINRTYRDLLSANWKSKVKLHQGLGTLAKAAGMLKEPRVTVNIKEYTEDLRNEKVRKTAMHMRGIGFTKEEEKTYLQGTLGDLTPEEMLLIQSTRQRRFYVPDDIMLKYFQSNSFLSQKGFGREFIDVCKKLILETNAERIRVKKPFDTRSSKKWSVIDGKLHILGKVAYEEISDEQAALYANFMDQIANLEFTVEVYGSRSRFAQNAVQVCVNLFKDIISTLRPQNFFAWVVDITQWLLFRKRMVKVNLNTFVVTVDDAMSIHEYTEDSKIKWSSEEMMFFLTIIQVQGAELDLERFITDMLKPTDIAVGLAEISEKLIAASLKSTLGQKMLIIKTFMETIIGTRYRGMRTVQQDKWGNARTKSVFEVNKQTVMNYLTGADNSRQFEEMKILLEPIQEIVGQAEKEQHSGPRELAVQTYVARLRADFLERICEAINYYIPEEAISKGSRIDDVSSSFWNQVSKFYASPGDKMHKSASLCSSDHATWSPCNTGCKFLISFVPFERIVDKNTMNMIHLSCFSKQAKRDEIPAQVWQKLFVQIKDEDWIPKNAGMTYMRKHFRETGETFYNKQVDTKQGIFHAASSTFVCMVSIETYVCLQKIMKEYGIELAFRFIEGSDDLLQMFLVNREGALEPFVQMSDKELHKFLQEVIKAAESCVGLSLSPKSAQSFENSEFYSKFSSRSRVFAVQVKFYTAQAMLSPAESMEGQQSSLRNTLLEMGKQGCSVLLQSCFWGSYVTRLCAITGAHEIAKLLNVSLTTLPICLGGVVTPNPTSTFFMNVSKVEITRTQWARANNRASVIRALSWTQAGTASDISDHLVQYGEPVDTIYKLPYKNPRHNQSDALRKKSEEIEQIKNETDKIEGTYLREFLKERMEPLTTEVEVIRYWKQLESKNMIRKMIGTTHSQAVAIFREKYNGKYLHSPVNTHDLNQWGISYYQTKDNMNMINLADFIRITTKLDMNDDMRPFINQILNTQVTANDNSAVFDSYVSRRPVGYEQHNSSVSSLAAIPILRPIGRVVNQLEYVVYVALYPEEMKSLRATNIQIETLSTDISQMKSECANDYAVLEELKETSSTTDNKIRFRIQQAFQNIRERVGNLTNNEIKFYTSVTTKSSGVEVMNAFSMYNIIGGIRFDFENRGDSLDWTDVHTSQNELLKIIVSICGSVSRNSAEFKINLTRLMNMRTKLNITVSTIVNNLVNSPKREAQRLSRMVSHLMGLSGTIHNNKEYLTTSSIGVKSVSLPGYTKSLHYTGLNCAALFLQRDTGCKVVSSSIDRNLLSEAMAAFEYHLSGSQIARMGKIYDWSQLYTMAQNVIFKDGAAWVTGVNRQGIPYIRDFVTPEINARFIYATDNVKVEVRDSALTVVAQQNPDRVMLMKGNLLTTLHGRGVDLGPLGMQYEKTVKNYGGSAGEVVVDRFKFSRTSFMSNYTLIKDVMDELLPARSRDLRSYIEDRPIQSISTDDKVTERMRYVGELDRVRQMAMWDNELQHVYDNALLMLKEVDPNYYYMICKQDLTDPIIAEESDIDVDFDDLISKVITSKSAAVPLEAIIIMTKLENLDQIDTAIRKLRLVCKLNTEYNSCRLLYYFGCVINLGRIITLSKASSDSDIDYDQRVRNPSINSSNFELGRLEGIMLDEGSLKKTSMNVLFSLLKNTRSMKELLTTNMSIRHDVYSSQYPAIIIVCSDILLPGLFLRAPLVALHGRLLALEEQIDGQKEQISRNKDALHEIRVTIVDMHQEKDARRHRGELFDDLNRQISDLHDRQTDCVQRDVTLTTELNRLKVEKQGLNVEIMIAMGQISNNQIDTTEHAIEKLLECLDYIIISGRMYTRMTSSFVDYKYYADLLHEDEYDRLQMQLMF